MLSWIVMGIAVGWLCARTYYAFFTKDWGSWGWSKNKWWIRYHQVCCYLCPRKHYCTALKENKGDKE